MVRVRVLYQGITHDLDAVAETIEHVGDLLEEFKAPSIARVYNITGTRMRSFVLSQTAGY
jgi:cell division ATPase FtsA